MVKQLVDRGIAIAGVIPVGTAGIVFIELRVGVIHPGAGQVIAIFLSIHIGVLMDRFGTRKVPLFSILYASTDDLVIALNKTAHLLTIWPTT